MEPPRGNGNKPNDDEWMSKMSGSMNQSDQELLRRLRANGGASDGMMQQQQHQQQQQQQQNDNNNSGGGVGGDQRAEEELLMQLLYTRRRRQHQQQMQEGMMNGGGGGGHGGSTENYFRNNGGGNDASSGNPSTNLSSSEAEQLQKLREQQEQAATMVNRRNSLSGAAERRNSMLSTFSDTSVPAGGSGSNNMNNTNSNNMHDSRPTSRGTGSISPFNANMENPSMRRPSMMGGWMNMNMNMNNMGNMNGMNMNGMGNMMDPYHQDNFGGGQMGLSSSQGGPNEYLNSSRLMLQRQQESGGMMMPSGLFSSMNGGHPHPSAVGSSFMMDRERMMDFNLYGHTREQLAQAQAHTEKLLLREQLQHRQLQQNQMQRGGANVKKKRAPARKKAPTNKPRRPLSAYNLFFSEERERILKEIDEKEALEKGEEPKKEGGDNNSDKMGGKEGGKTDGDGDDDDDVKKEKLTGKKEESETLAEELDKDNDNGGSGGGDDNDEDEDGKKRKIPKAFLRPLLPVQRKRRAHRKTHGKISFRLLAQMVGARWKALPDDDRKYYQDLAKEDSIRQKEAMKEYYRMEQRQQTQVRAPIDVSKPNIETGDGNVEGGPSLIRLEPIAIIDSNNGGETNVNGEDKDTSNNDNNMKNITMNVAESSSKNISSEDDNNIPAKYEV